MGRKQARSVLAIRPGYFKCMVGSHVLFYCFVDADWLDVVRILR